MLTTFRNYDGIHFYFKAASEFPFIPDFCCIPLCSITHKSFSVAILHVYSSLAHGKKKVGQRAGTLFFTLCSDTILHLLNREVIRKSEGRRREKLQELMGRLKEVLYDSNGEIVREPTQVDILDKAIETVKQHKKAERKKKQVCGLQVCVLPLLRIPTPRVVTRTQHDSLQTAQARSLLCAQANSPHSNSTFPTVTLDTAIILTSLLLVHVTHAQAAARTMITTYHSNTLHSTNSAIHLNSFHYEMTFKALLAKARRGLAEERCVSWCNLFCFVSFHVTGPREKVGVTIGCCLS